MERLIGRDAHRIDYRHIIHTLVRKPGAFRRYVFREALFPTLEFRRTYDALRCREDPTRPTWSTCGSCTWRPAMARRPSERFSPAYWPRQSIPTYEAVRAQVRGPRTPQGVPFLDITAPDLSLYDRLLGMNDETVCA